MKRDIEAVNAGFKSLEDLVLRMHQLADVADDYAGGLVNQFKLDQQYQHLSLAEVQNCSFLCELVAEHARKLTEAYHQAWEGVPHE